MFGYLAFVALCLSLGAIVLVVVVDTAKPMAISWMGLEAARYTGFAVLFLINIVLAHMVATTCHGLYYLIDRLYAVAPVLLDKDGSVVEPDQRRE
jgi:hypothetical protein